MHASLTAISSVCLLLASSIPAVSAITLAQFQPINGFSQACVNAYNTPLSGCTASDFENGSCSTTCIAFLEALTQVLNSECGGASAYPNTLIGAFFKNQGTSTLCPNMLDSNGGTNEGSTTVAGQASASTSNLYMSASTAMPSSYTSETLPILSAAPSQFITTASTASSTASAAATTTQVTVVSTTVSPETSSIQPSHSSTDKAYTKSSAISTSEESKTTSSGSGDGGGSPLDVSGSSAAPHNAKVKAWLQGLLTGAVGLLFLL